ncbi:MAG: hypothetical protein L0Y71_25800 [Gemmataceae bacterium]|nr:hypothetical protein [Gemmataceae bacterium]
MAEICEAEPERPSTWLARHGESCWFWLLTLAHLVPIWSFTYVPTQDGPAHLSGATILKDYGAPGTRYHEFFEVRLEPTPNWSAHLLLAGLMFVLPPLIAEKALVSGYVFALAGALRYFCGAFGPRTRPLALVGLLFAYNRCLWLGFYNFNLSLALCLFILGYWLRRRAHTDALTAAALTLLLVVTFFTHLVGFLVAAVALLWLAMTMGPRRLRNLAWVALACVPASLLAVDYFDRTGFFGVGGSQRLRDHAWLWLQGRGSWARLGDELIAIDNETFAHHSIGDAPLGFMVAVLYLVLLSATILAVMFSEGEASRGPPRWPVALLALALAATYVLAPQHLSMEHGGFLKSRLALFPPLLLLACFREPPWLEARWGLRGLIVAALAVNLVFVTRQFALHNHDLAEYTAARELADPGIGPGRIMFVVQEQAGRGGRELADPLLHASQHYALGTNTVNLDNYQATTRHFPLRLKAGVARGRGIFAFYDRQDVVDVILTWDAGRNPGVPHGFQSIFREGRLQVFSKK